MLALPIDDYVQMAALQNMEPDGPTYLAALEKGLRQGRARREGTRSVADKQAILLASLRARGHAITHVRK